MDVNSVSFSSSSTSEKKDVDYKKTHMWSTIGSIGCIAAPAACDIYENKSFGAFKDKLCKLDSSLKTFSIKWNLIAMIAGFGGGMCLDAIINHHRKNVAEKASEQG